MGFTEMSEIQTEAIPAILAGKDIVGLARTGTGKTGAFGIPMLEMIDTEAEGIQGLILCPTRELAMQVTEELRKMSKQVEGIRILAVYGGADIGRQITALKKGVQIVVGTPGRVMDHIRRGSMDLSHLRMLVMDEADEMLDMGFREDMFSICEDIPGEHQTELFSATMSETILELTKKFQTEPMLLEISHDEMTVPSIRQFYYKVKNEQKDAALYRLIDYMSPKRAVIFCNTKKKVDSLTFQLKKNGYSAEALHGDFPQNQRDKVMNLFRSGNLELLLATDMVARGIDVEDVDLVFNYDLPRDMEYYVHRIGRTGRNGKKGKAVSLINTREEWKIRSLEEFCGTRIRPKKMPSYDEVLPIKASSDMTKAIESCREQDMSLYQRLIEERCEKDGMELAFLAAVLLKQSLGEERDTFEISEENVAERRKKRFREERESRRGEGARSRRSSSEEKPRRKSTEGESTRRSRSGERSRRASAEGEKPRSRSGSGEGFWRSASRGRTSENKE